MMARLPIDRGRAIATFKTVFPPLLIELQHHLLFVKSVVDRVFAEDAAVCRFARAGILALV